MRVRRSVVAGSFYEYDPNALKEQIEWCFLHRLGPGKLPEPVDSKPRSIVGVISPHAGYMYSGPIAAHSYYALSKEGRPEFIVILGPNHTGYGAAVSIMTDGLWETPLGRVEVDSELASKIVKACKIVRPDYEAHIFEHSVEVQLPFLQYVYGNTFKFVPIIMMDQTLETAKKLGEALAKVGGDDVLFIASTDLSHYEPHNIAVKLDSQIIEAVKKMDPHAIYEAVYRKGISMCGPGPVMTMIFAAKTLGYERAEILKYATSGDVSGDKSAVVGYLSAIIFKEL